MLVSRLSAAVALCAIATTAANAATLLSDGTLNTTGDLTRIDDGGTILEFLDWSVTVGQSVDTALATYSSDGFSVADETQIAALFDAFGMVYAFTAGVVTDLTTPGYVTPSEADAFLASLGATDTLYRTGAHYIDSTGTDPYAYLCVSNAPRLSQGCGPSSFTYDLDVSSGDDFLGTALVRSSALAPIPLPAGFPLLLAALGCVGVLKKRKRQS